MKRCARSGCKRMATAHRKWCLKCRKKDRAHKLGKRYGITQLDYDARVRDQDGKCAICEDEIRYVGCVDHEHTEHYVRNILCTSCNVMLGNARDNHVILRRASSYIVHHRRHKGRVSFLKRRPRSRKQVDERQLEMFS